MGLKFFSLSEEVCDCDLIVIKLNFVLKLFRALGRSLKGYPLKLE